MEITHPTLNHFTIYTKKDCTFCEKVKELIKNEKTTIICCDNFLKENKDIFLLRMHQFTEIPYKTFPMVFYEGKFIGGYRDTEKWINKRNAFSGIEFENI